MTDSVKIVECPRDAWQALPGILSAQEKSRYLRRLIAAGFTHIDAVSFVSPSAVPQMADSEEVLDLLDPPDDIEIIGIVVNGKGAERAIQTGAVQTLGFPYSISPEFLRRNQRQTQDEALRAIEEIGTLAYKSGMHLVTYISMAFGNPYGDPWSIQKISHACNSLTNSGVWQISLADTVGLATPSQIADVVSQVFPQNSRIEMGLHLHARREDAAAKIHAAYEAGCRRFDAAIGGLGGCPFAQDDLVGNIPTEILIAELTALGAQLPQFQHLEELLQTSAQIAAAYGSPEADCKPSQVLSHQDHNA